MVPDPNFSIRSADDPRVAFFRSLKGNAPRLERRGVILVEGEQQIGRLLETDLELVTLFLEERFYLRFAAHLAEKNLSGVECFAAERAVMESIVGYRLHQGAMALARRPKPKLVSELPLPCVALNGIIDPENVGSIARSAAAFGLRSILYDRLSCDPYLRRSIRVSMGAALFLDTGSVDDLAPALDSMKERAIIVGVEQSDRAEPLSKSILPQNSVFVFGNEKRGLNSDVIDVCDRIISIPMEQSVVTSLNVGATAALVLGDYYRNQYS